MNRQERRRLGKTVRPQEEAAKLAEGIALHRAGRWDAAEAVFRQVLRVTPGHPDATRLLGEVLLDLGRFAEALDLLRRLTRDRPKEFQTHYTLGNAHRMARQWPEALAAYRAALALQPGFGGAHHGLGIVLRQTQQEAEAAAEFRKATAAMPGWAVAWKDLGITLAMVGDLVEAEQALSRAVTLAPELGDARRHLAALRKERADAAEIAGLARQAADPRLPAGEKIEMLFALGHQEDASGKYGDAFRYFAAANAMLRAMQAKAGFGFDRRQLAAEIDALTAAFPAEVFARRAGGGDESDAPVFIVGMPRAGSTLFEQIAASHGQVFGAGEHDGIGRIAQKLGAFPRSAWTSDAIFAAARDYLAALQAKAGNAARVLDKMPDNIFQLGLIATLFPSARVIFCARDPRDTALSCFFQHFSAPLGYDTDLEDCTFRISQIERLTAHWRRVLPLRHMTMSYEALLAAPDVESRRLIAFLGLEWEPACLEFHKNSRVVRTASWSQVRRPLYQNAAGRWRHYAAHLPPVLLDYAEAARNARHPP